MSHRCQKSPHVDNSRRFVPPVTAGKNPANSIAFHGLRSVVESVFYARSTWTRISSARAADAGGVRRGETLDPLFSPIWLFRDPGIPGLGTLRLHPAPAKPVWSYPG